MQISDDERTLFEQEREDYRKLLSGVVRPCHSNDDNKLRLTCIGNAGGSDAIIHGYPSGGFILAYAGRTIIVDPGENSIAFLVESGFDPYSITDVAASHAHSDHTGDLALVAAAAIKLNLNENCHPEFLVSPALVDYANADATRYGFTLPAFAWNGDVKVLSCQDVTVTRFDGIQFPAIESVRLNDSIEVSAARGKHAEALMTGFIFNTPMGRISYTGDTEYFPELADQYAETDVLWMNINSLGLDNVTDIGPAPQKQMPIHNHLGYLGVCQLIEAVQPRIAIVSHFGAQLLTKVDEIQALLRKRYHYQSTEIYCAHSGDCFNFEKTLASLPVIETLSP